MALAIAGCGGGSAPAQRSASTPAKPSTAEVNPSGDIPDNQAYVAFSPSGGGFSVKVPEGWSRSAAGGVITFTDKLNAIRIESHPGGAVSAAKARRTEVPQLARTVPGYQAGKLSTVSRTAGPAVRITYLATAKPNAVTGKAGKDAVERYLFAHGGRDVVLTLSGPKGADNVDPWRIVTDSLRWR
jgi:hypothetical protein